MKKTTVTTKILATLLGLCLISIIACQTDEFRQKEKFAHETKVFFWYADSIRVNVPEEHHSFILIPDASCKGCAKKAIDEWYPASENTTFIVTSNIAKSYCGNIINLHNIHIDTLGLINNLNWDLGNIIKIETEAQKVVFIKSYSVEEMF